jgi:hypothetical protein
MDEQAKDWVHRAQEAQAALDAMGAGRPKAEVENRVISDQEDKGLVDDQSYPLLSQRYGPDNPGVTDKERNLWAQGALWQFDRTAAMRAAR